MSNLQLLYRKRNPTLLLLQILFYVNILSSCISASSFQLAKTTPPKQISATVALSKNTIKIINENSVHNLLNKINNDISIFNISGNIRYGLFNRIDMGIGFSLPGLVSLDTKYNFFSHNKHHTATALALSGIKFKTYKPSTDRITITDKTILLYHTYEIKEKISLTLKNFLNIRRLTEQKNAPNYKEYYFLGVGFGMLLKWFFFDITVFKDIEQSKKYFKQFSIGYSIK
jgi:hypothetical protein